MSEHPYAGKIAQQRARERADAIRWRAQLDEPLPDRRPIPKRRRRDYRLLKVAAAQ